MAKAPCRAPPLCAVCPVNKVPYCFRANCFTCTLTWVACHTSHSLTVGWLGCDRHTVTLTMTGEIAVHVCCCVCVSSGLQHGPVLLQECKTSWNAGMLCSLLRHRGDRGDKVLPPQFNTVSLCLLPLLVHVAPMHPHSGVTAQVSTVQKGWIVSQYLVLRKSSRQV